MNDLNDLQSFVLVAEHQGYTAAEYATGVSKSVLSRHVAQLEKRLKTRLIERSKRRFSLTDAGALYLRHARAAVAEAKAGEEALARSRDTPCGEVRISCPTMLLELRIGAMLASYLRQHPQVRLQVEATNRVVNPQQGQVDIALRVRPLPLADTTLVMRKLSLGPQCLVASPTLLAALGAPEHPSELMRFPSLGLGGAQTQHLWNLHGPDGAHFSIHHEPRLMTRGMSALRDAAVAGVGVVQLPTMLTGPLIDAGILQPVLPQWRPRDELVHAVFVSRQGLSTAARVLLDHLTAGFLALGEHA